MTAEWTSHEQTNSSRRMPRLRRVAFGVTVPSTAQAFLRGQLCWLVAHSWEVHVLVGEAGLGEFAQREGVTKVHVIAADRRPSLRDPVTLLQSWRLLRRIRPSATVMGTPKMGVVGTVAAWMARVPVRIYLVHGHRSEGLVGARRMVMVTLEKVACACATHVVAVSPSLRAVMAREGIAPMAKVTVMGSGSANGVDTRRFTPPTAYEKLSIRRELGLPEVATVLAFVGRLTKDKGIQDLPRIWQDVSSRRTDAWLVIAGTSELTGSEDEAAWNKLRSAPRVLYVGQMADVERIFRASDLLLLLSRREGLGMVALEAASCAVPAVALAATGVVDAVVHGETGVLVPMGATERAEVTQAVTRLMTDVGTRLRMGSQARQRVVAEFQETKVWQHWTTLLESAVAAAERTNT